MSPETPLANISHLWWSPSDLHDLLAIISPDDTASPSVASSSRLPNDQVPNVSSATSRQSVSLFDIDTLSQYWHPCTGGQTIGSCLETFEFPVSFRDLVYRWEEAGSSALRSLRVPFGLQLRASATDADANRNQYFDLHTITETQEHAIIAAIEDYFQRGCIEGKDHSFVSFASHLDIYTSLHVELMARQEGWSRELQASAYDSTWRSLLDAFQRDRARCTNNVPHDCFQKLLWGEVSTWPVSEIKRHFKAYKMLSPSSRTHSATSMPTSPLSSRKPSVDSTQTWAGETRMLHSPHLSSSSSSNSFDRTHGGSRGGRINSLQQSPSVDPAASPWALCSTLGSPITPYSTSSSYEGVSPAFVLPEGKPWVESVVHLQAQENVPAGSQRIANPHPAIDRRLSCSPSYSKPMQISQAPFLASQLDGSLTPAVSGSTHSQDAFMLATQYPRDLQSLQHPMPMACPVMMDHWQDDSTPMWMQQHRSLLQNAAVQLDMAAQLLSAKASARRYCQDNQQQRQTHPI